MARDYEELLNAMDVLYTCSLMIDDGNWTRENCKFTMDSDYYHDVVLDALCCCYETTSLYCNEEHDVEHMYFSEPVMLEYYKLCREYSKRKNIKLRENPYMLEAKRFVDGHLSGPYTCWHILHTKVNHAGASGIHFMHDYEFYDFLPLLERLITIKQFYKEGVDKLRAELSKTTALAVIYPPILPFPLSYGNRDREAVAA